MKKVFILSLLASFFAASLSAGGFKESLAEALAPSADKYLLFTQGFTPSSRLQKEPSFWDGLISCFSSSDREEKQEAVAQYIYNMYIIDAAKGLSLPQPMIDTSYTGALDPIYRSDFKNGAEIKNFYYKNLDAINAKIGLFFSQKRFLNYNPKDEKILKQQSDYINMLVNTYNKNKAFSYNYGPAALSRQELTSAKKSLLKKYISDNNKINKDLSVIYEHTDPIKMLDNATRVGGSAVSAKSYTYRPLSQECAACSYSFCKHICDATQSGYSLYKLLRVYEIYAKPSTGLLKNAKGRREFFSPQGEKYPSWDYHAAVLLVFEEESALSFTVVDTLLSEEPVSYENWLAFFDRADTFFTITPFIRRASVEKTFLPTEEIPSSYQPHPVRN